MANIVLGVTGSIAAYKAADIASQLVKLGHDVHVVCTQKATEFITPLTLQTMSRNRVFTSFEDEKDSWVPPHIALAQSADLLVIAPATANTIANMAWGQAPDILTSLYLANRAPVLICPAMNTMMWGHEATQNNINLLKARSKHYVLGPAEDGELACGAKGAGKLVPVDAIIQYITELLKQHPASH